MNMDQKIEIAYPGISGDLQVTVDAENGKTTVYLSGDKDGLLSLAEMLRTLARLDQTSLTSLPAHGACEHVHLKPNRHLTKTSRELVVGRLDDKSGQYDESIVTRTAIDVAPIIHLW